MLGLGSLRCRLGWHRPRAGGRWNHGYCFTGCERCGRDMVKSAFGEWHVPRGFRVVANGGAGAVAALDAVLAARDAGGAVMASAGAFAWADTEANVATPVAPPKIARPSVPPPRPAPPSRPARPAPAGSPFDFADFDVVDAGAGVAPPPPLRPDPARPPLSRAAT